jgi:hypothetical protein
VRSYSPPVYPLTRVLKWDLDMVNPMIHPAGYKREELFRVLGPLRRPENGGDPEFAPTLKDMEGMIGRCENIRTVVTRFLPSLLPFYKLKFMMELQREEYRKGKKSLTTWRGGWRIGPNNEVRYRAEEMLKEIEVGFTLRDWNDAQMTRGLIVKLHEILNRAQTPPHT